MIVTVTPNPSIDRTVTLPTELVRGAVHRVRSVYNEPGGKGVNVARALTLAEFEGLFGALGEVRRAFYKYPVRVDDLLARSFPEPGGADAFRRTVEADIGPQELGIDASRDADGGLRFAFPVAVFSGSKRA